MDRGVKDVTIAQHGTGVQASAGVQLAVYTFHSFLCDFSSRIPIVTSILVAGS